MGGVVLGPVPAWPCFEIPAAPILQGICHELLVWPPILYTGLKFGQPLFCKVCIVVLYWVCKNSEFGAQRTVD